MNDIILNKKESIELCIKQIRKYYETSANKSLAEDYLRQDAIAINIQRACEQTIDLANWVIKNWKLGLPKESKESFLLLAKENIISKELASKLQGMVGFRNILVHQYQDVDIDIMILIIEKHLVDFVEFTNDIMEFAEK